MTTQTNREQAVLKRLHRPVLGVIATGLVIAVLVLGPFCYFAMSLLAKFSAQIDSVVARLDPGDTALSFVCVVLIDVHRRRRVHRKDVSL